MADEDNTESTDSSNRMSRTLVKLNSKRKANPAPQTPAKTRKVSALILDSPGQKITDPEAKSRYDKIINQDLTFPEMQLAFDMAAASSPALTAINTKLTRNRSAHASAKQLAGIMAVAAPDANIEV